MVVELLELLLAILLMVVELFELLLAILFMMVELLELLLAILLMVVELLELLAAILLMVFELLDLLLAILLMTIDAPLPFSGDVHLQRAQASRLRGVGRREGHQLCEAGRRAAYGKSWGIGKNLAFCPDLDLG